MRNVRMFALAGLLAALLFALPASAQLVTLTSTTTAAAMSATDRVICLTSATGVSVPGVGALGSSLYVGGTEIMRVQSVTTASATCFNVTRTRNVVGHASGETVYIGAAQLFKSKDMAGTCVLGSMEVRPWINLTNNNVWDCVDSKYQVINGPAASNVGVTALGPGTAGAVDIGSAALPFRKLYLGTAATNNMVITPAATAAARIITMTDPGGAASLAYTNPTTAQTITNTTLTAPTINSPLVNTTAKLTTQFDAVTGTTGTTLTNLTGMVLTVVPGTYRFRINLPMVTTANAGVKVGFKLTGTVLTSIDYTSRLFTASGVAVQHGTTAADQTAMAALTAAATINTVIEGSFVVGTGGTMQLQGAQNAAHADTLSIYAGATMSFERIL